MRLPLWLWLVCSLGFSQTLELNTNSISFHPDTATYTEALLCSGCNSLEPFVSRGFEITATNPQRFPLQVRRNTFLPSTDVTLEARYTVFDSQSNLIESTDWLDVLEKPQTLFNSENADFTVSVDYRLRITGQELAGTYQTTLNYNLGIATLHHHVSISIPSVTLLRLGQQLTGLLSVSFDYQGPSAIDYIRAIQNYSPLPLTDSNLETIEVFSNHPRGYSVTLNLHDLGNPSTLDLRLFNKPLNGQILQSSNPTDGFETLVTVENFSLFVNGSEEPGEYRFILEYDAVSNP